MLKILDGSTKVSKTSPLYNIVVDKLNEGVDPDSVEMEYFYDKALKDLSKIEKLAMQVLLHGKALVPHLYELVEGAIEAWKEDYGCLNKTVISLITYLQKADFRFNKHRDYKAIALNMGLTPDSVSLAGFTERLKEVYKCISVFDLEDSRSDKARILASRKVKFPRGAYTTATGLINIVPALVSLANLSPAWGQKVLDSAGPLKCLGKGSLGSRLENGINRSLTGLGAERNLSSLGESLFTLIGAAIAALPSLESFSPYILPIAAASSPGLFSDEKLVPNACTARDETGAWLPHYAVESDFELGGASGRKIISSHEFEMDAFRQHDTSNSRKKNPVSNDKVISRAIPQDSQHQTAQNILNGSCVEITYPVVRYSKFVYSKSVSLEESSMDPGAELTVPAVVRLPLH